MEYQGKHKEIIEHPGHREGLREQLLARVKRGFHITDTDVADLLREAVEALQRVEPERDEWKEVAEFKQAEAMKYHNLYAALEGALTARAEEWEAEAATCENRRGIENFKRDPQRFAILTRVARELRALLSAPAAAGHDAQCEAEQPALPVTGYTACGCADRAAAESAVQEKSQLNDGAMEGIAGLRGKLAEALAERDALKVKRDVALRAWKGAAADRDKAQRQVADLRAEVASLKAENERLKQSAVEVAKLNQPNLEQIMALSVEVESLKAKLAALSAGEQSAEATRTALEADLAEFKEVAAFETAEALKYEAQLNALEGALKAKAEEWHKKTAGYSVWDDAANELAALLSAPAAAGSAGQEHACEHGRVEFGELGPGEQEPR